MNGKYKIKEREKYSEWQTLNTASEYYSEYDRVLMTGALEPPHELGGGKVK